MLTPCGLGAFGTPLHMSKTTRHRVNASRHYRLWACAVHLHEDWWKDHAVQFPYVAELARKFLTSPASSLDTVEAEVEYYNIYGHRRATWWTVQRIWIKKESCSIPFFLFLLFPFCCNFFSSLVFFNDVTIALNNNVTTALTVSEPPCRIFG